MTSLPGSARRIWGDFEKVSELRWDLPRGKTVGFRLLAETFVAGATRVGGGGGRWKSQNRKIGPLSPYVEEPLRSEVIKSFLPEQSRYVFFEFHNVLSLWTYGVRFIHSHIRAMVHGDYTAVIVMMVLNLP